MLSGRRAWEFLEDGFNKMGETNLSRFINVGEVLVIFLGLDRKLGLFKENNVGIVAGQVMEIGEHIWAKCGVNGAP